MADEFAALPTPDSCWNIIVCGDFEDPVVLFIPYKSTVTQLKEEVEKKTNIPVSEQTLYCQEIPLPEAKLLVECHGIDNGVALCLVRKPFIINVYRPDGKVNVRVEIPRNELDIWTVSILRNYISSRVGFQEDYDHIYVVDGTMIKMDVSELKLNVCSAITDGCTMTVTFLKKVNIETPHQDNNKWAEATKRPRSFYVPVSSSQEFIMSKVSYQRSNCDWKGAWTVYIQQIDGSKRILYLKESSLTPVYKLRESLSETYAIPSYQQRLTVGDTVLEDWDVEGRPFLLANYPAIHDGVTLYLVCLTEGIHVKVYISNYNELTPSPINLFYTKTSSWIFYNPYINIFNPKEMMLSRLLKLIQEMSCGSYYSSVVYEISTDKKCESKQVSLEEGDVTIASIPWIIDGCTVSVNPPRLYL